MTHSGGLVTLKRLAAGVAHVQLTRASKLNALTVPMQDLVETANALASDSAVRCVVLSGEGKSFSAGIDLGALSDASNMKAIFSHAPPLASPRANLVQTLAVCWRRVPVPVFVALKGDVFGAGLQLALGGDVRFAAPAARLSIMEAKHGLIPDCGISETARGIVRPDVLKLLAWSAELVSARDAERFGLVTRVLDDSAADVDQYTLDYAGKLASTANGDALRGVKRLVHETMIAPAAQQDAGLALEEAIQLQILGSPAFQQKMAQLRTAMTAKK